MSKNKKNQEPEVEVPTIPDTMTVEGEEVELKTKKSYLKTAEKITRRLDRVLTDLNDLSQEARTLANTVIETEVSEKDIARFSELAALTTASVDMLYYLTSRMARKYVGKEIEGLNDGRKSLRK